MHLGLCAIFRAYRPVKTVNFPANFDTYHEKPEKKLRPFSVVSNYSLGNVNSLELVYYVSENRRSNRKFDLFSCIELF